MFSNCPNYYVILNKIIIIIIKVPLSIYSSHDFLIQKQKLQTFLKIAFVIFVMTKNLAPDVQTPRSIRDIAAQEKKLIVLGVL